MFFFNKLLLSRKHSLFMELQVSSDKPLKVLAFLHVIHSIRRMNQKHKTETKNRALQSILFSMLQEEDKKKAMRLLVTICDLHRRKVMIVALSFLIDYEKIEQENDSDESSDEEEPTHQPYVVVSKEAIYKANNTETMSSKKKKKAKLQRVIRSMKKDQRMSSERENNMNYYSPLTSLKDPQIKMMIVKVVARTVGLHRLILFNFYPFLQKYVQSIVVGLDVVREICLRILVLMTEDLLQDLVLYQKSFEKANSYAAHSLISLFRKVCPSLLVKKDRGRPIDPKQSQKHSVCQLLVTSVQIYMAVRMKMKPRNTTNQATKHSDV
ncbi:putative SDA1 domain-containing protein [Helianthus anomalus]